MWEQIEKQRGVLKDERGSVVKDWGGKTSVALVYPNTYEIGMSNLAVHSIYKLFNDERNIVCERAFLPGRGDLAEHIRTGVPVLSVETQRPLAEFDCVAFSVSFQNDFLNIMPILSLCSIPHAAKERNKDHPLLIAGGCAVTINHLPVAQIFDAIVTGEAEEIIPEISGVLNGHGSRADILKALSKIEGIIVPALGKTRTSRRFVKNLDDFPTETVIYTPKTEFGDMHLIETGRGCPRRCKFCVTPALYAPLRVRSFEAILKMVKDGIAKRKRFGLIGSDLLSHKSFVDVANAIHDLGATFSPSSLCVDEIDDRIAALLAKSGHKSISLGLEAASDRLRSSIGKKFSAERILEAANSLARHGICSLRLYFMIGLPGETPDDIEEIARLAVKVQEAIHAFAPKNIRATKVTLTLSPFVPKPMTPFQDEPFAGEKYLKDAIRTLKKLLGKTRGIQIHADPVKDAKLEAELSKGHQRALAKT